MCLPRAVAIQNFRLPAHAVLFLGSRVRAARAMRRAGWMTSESQVLGMPAGWVRMGMVGCLDLGDRISDRRHGV